MLIGFELVFDLAKDFLCKRLRGRENGNRYFRVANNLLNGASYSNDAGFPMPPRPEIDATVRFRFHLPAARAELAPSISFFARTLSLDRKLSIRCRCRIALETRYRNRSFLRSRGTANP